MASASVVSCEQVKDNTGSIFSIKRARQECHGQRLTICIFSITPVYTSGTTAYAWFVWDRRQCAGAGRGFQTKCLRTPKTQTNLLAITIATTSLSLAHVSPSGALRVTSLWALQSSLDNGLTAAIRCQEGTEVCRFLMKACGALSEGDGRHQNNHLHASAKAALVCAVTTWDKGRQRLADTAGQRATRGIRAAQVPWI